MDENPDVESKEEQQLDPQIEQVLFIAANTTPEQRFQWLEEMPELSLHTFRVAIVRTMTRCRSRGSEFVLCVKWDVTVAYPEKSGISGVSPIRILLENFAQHGETIRRAVTGGAWLASRS